MAYWEDYVWIVVVGAFLAFFTAYGIGANDVANAFASSVGSKALTLRQAVMIAAVFEFAGAVLLGSQVTDTVRKKIADNKAFKEDPEVLMYGMLCVLFATGLWLMLASYAELPVSTTHSVIGGIIGMSLAAKGSDAVVWADYDGSKEALKKFSGVAPVIVSWVVSPVCAGIFAVTIFLFTRTVVLRSQQPFQRTMIFFPILVGLTVMVNAYFILYKGFSRKIKGEKLYEYLGGYVHLIAWVLGAIVGGAVYFVLVPKLRVICPIRAKANAALEASASMKQDIKEGVEGQQDKKNGMLEFDASEVIAGDSTVADVHEKAEVFDSETEEAFKFLQVFTAMCDSFAHGANDVANSIGPFAAIYGIYKAKSVEKKSDVPIWILVMGGAGIVVGLATYGYKIISAIGVKLVKITPSRGFAIELGSACIIILGSRYGLPLSTTHCQVGATVGVGLLEGRQGKGVNGRLFLKVIGGWILTLVVVGFTAAAFFAQGAYAPSITNLDEITRYRESVDDTISDLAGILKDNAVAESITDSNPLNVEDPPQTDISVELLSVLKEATDAAVAQCS